MAGHIRKRYESSWIVVVELGRDPVTGKRIRRQRSVRGTKRDAERVLREMEQQAIGGAAVSAPADMTVADLLDQWLDHVRQHRERRTYDGYAAAARRIREALGRIRLEQLRPAHIQRFYDSLQQDGARRDGQRGGLGPESIRHHHRALHAALSYAVRMDLLVRNPAERVTLPKRQQRDTTVLTREQIDQLLAAVEGTRWYALFYLAAHTGMRVGELCGLWWDDVLWQESAIMVRRALKRVAGGRPRLGDVKNHEQRKVYLRPRDVEVLEAHRERQAMERRMTPGWLHPEHVFTTPTGDLLYPTVPSQVLRKLCRKIGLPPVSMHTLRHSHGSHLLAYEGWDLAAVSERLGHATPAFTAQVYIHVIPGLQKRYVSGQE